MFQEDAAHDNEIEDEIEAHDQELYEHPELFGFDRGSPDGDCTVRGVKHADGTYEVTEISYTPPLEKDGP